MGENPKTRLLVNMLTLYFSSKTRENLDAAALYTEPNLAVVWPKILRARDKTHGTWERYPSVFLPQPEADSLILLGTRANTETR